MEISPVATRADLEAFHAVESASRAHDHVGLPADPLEEWLPLLDQPEVAGERVQLYVGRVDGEPVGSASLRMPLLDNQQVVSCALMVHPRHRRRGHGRGLVDHVLTETRRLGRSRLFVQVAALQDAPPLGLALLEKLGARPVIEDVRRVLDLHDHTPRGRCPVPDGYRVVQWLGQAPEELVDGCAYLMGRMTVDAPMGDMDYAPEKWDAVRYRARERAVRDRQRLLVSSAAVHESGQVVGMTDIGISLAEPEVGQQWYTVVDRDHRGHGLGLVLKTWNHAQLGEAAPRCRYLNTWNASSNSFMVRVNDALGYRPVETWTEWQLDL